MPKSLQTVSDEMLMAIGRLIMTASAVEAQVGFQILRMISPIEYVMDHAWPLVAGMDFKVKLSQIRTLIAAYPEPARLYIVECCDELQTYYSRRNDVAHRFIVPSRRGKYALHTMKGEAKTGVPASPIEVGPAELDEWGNRLLTWSNELEQALTDLGFPLSGPTPEHVGERPTEAQTEARRPKSRVPRPTRKRPRP